MRRFLGTVFGAVCCCIFFAATVQAKSLNKVYLKGGGVIECQTFWKADGKVMVRVNRDVLVDLSSEEVDMKRTFAKKPARKVKKGGTARKKAVPAAQPGTAAEAGKAPAVVGKPGGALAAKPTPQSAGAGTSAQPQKAGTPPVGQPTSGVTPKSSPQPPKGGSTMSPQKPGAPPSAHPVPAAAPKPGGPPAAQTGPAPVATSAPTGQQPTVASPAAKPAPVPPRPPLPIATTPPPPPAAVALGGMLGVGTLLPVVLIVLLMIASLWKVFSKAGEAGWQCLIPIWNMYVMVKISGKPWWWFLLMFVPIVSIVAAIIVNIALAERFRKGALFGLGLTFLGFIFIPILAFDSSRYE